jgi:hypothetical protein
MLSLGARLLVDLIEQRPADRADWHLLHDAADRSANPRARHRRRPPPEQAKCFSVMLRRDGTPIERAGSVAKTGALNEEGDMQINWKLAVRNYFPAGGRYSRNRLSAPFWDGDRFPTGAVVPQAKIRITNQAEKHLPRDPHGSQGNYEALNLKAGVYNTVSGRSLGFQSLQGIGTRIECPSDHARRYEARSRPSQ